MDQDRADAWLGSYGAAWEARDTAAFAALFTPDVRYHWTPFDAPKEGRDGVSTAFAAATARQRNIRFDAEIVSVDEASAIAHWRCTFDRIGTDTRVRLDGIFIMDFGDDGLCRRFREWWHSDEPVR